MEALCSPFLWKKDGLVTAQGSTTFWDRSTLYALRGIYAAGMADIATEKLKYYSARRLLGDHVPYAIEAWLILILILPRCGSSQRHLSAESGLYCRIITEGLFGMKPTGFRSFDLTPSMPTSWESMSIKNIKAFSDNIDIIINRTSSKKLKVVINSKKGQKKYAIEDG